MGDILIIVALVILILGGVGARLRAISKEDGGFGIFSIVLSVLTDETHSIGVYYVYTDGRYDPDWRGEAIKGMNYAIPRLNSFFLSRGISWIRNRIGDLFRNL